MTETKIRRSIWILIGLTVLILIGMSLGWLFVVKRPQAEQIADVQTKYNDRKGVAGKLKGNMDAQQKAEDKQRYAEAQLAYFRGGPDTAWRGRFRSFRFDDIGADPANLTPEQKAKRNDAFGRALRENFSNYGESLVAALLEQANSVPRVNGRKLVFETAMPKVDAPPKAPEDVVVPPTALIKPTSATGGGILSATVTGTFDQIKDYFNRINRSPILFVISTVKVEPAGAAPAAGAAATPVTTGAGSPLLKATFSITPYLLATGEGAQKLGIAVAAAPEGGNPDGGNPDGGGAPGADGATPPAGDTPTP